ncbi:hypothetical protein J6590_032440 [Homalodisca vitripennis]|nr:hypothetical protein J6590_032440 [Homalodisca vitripennis]
MIRSAGVTRRSRAGTVVIVTSGGDQSRTVSDDLVGYLVSKMADCSLTKIRLWVHARTGLAVCQNVYKTVVSMSTSVNFCRGITNW